MNKATKLRIVGYIMIILGISILFTFFFIRIVSKNEIKQVIDRFDEISNNEKTNENEKNSNNIKLSQLFNDMKKYNENLIKNGQEINGVLSFQDMDFDLTKYGYEENIIGKVRIPTLELELPIYLGTTDENLYKGSAHLSHTSLPLGEINSNCVIAAHRGLIHHQMFSRIINLKEGDKVYITNLWETMEYEVCDSKTISPSDTSQILIQKGKDMITLISCHPYEGNAKRYVVYCKRN